MLRVSYKNLAFPLMFKMLNKRGNSDTDERIDLIEKYISWFSLLADGEIFGRIGWSF